MIAITSSGVLTILAARGRGLGRLISNAMNGDPTAIGILAVAGVGIVGYIVYKARSGGE